MSKKLQRKGNILKVSLIAMILILIVALFTACNGAEELLDKVDTNLNGAVTLTGISGATEFTVDTNTKVVRATVGYNVSSIKESDLTFAASSGVSVIFYNDKSYADANIIQGNVVQLEVGENTFYVHAFFTSTPATYVRYTVIVTRDVTVTPGTKINTSGELVIERSNTSTAEVKGSAYAQPTKSNLSSATVQTGINNVFPTALLNMIGGDIDEAFDYEEIAEVLSDAGVTQSQFEQTTAKASDIVEDVLDIVMDLMQQGDLDDISFETIVAALNAENVAPILEKLGELVALYDANTVVALLDSLDEDALRMVENLLPFGSGSSEGYDVPIHSETGYYQAPANASFRINDNSWYGVFSDFEKEDYEKLLRDNGIDPELLSIYNDIDEGGFSYEDVIAVLKTKEGIYVIQKVLDGVSYVLVNDSATIANSVISALKLVNDISDGALMNILLRHSQDLLAVVKGAGNILGDLVEQFGDADVFEAALGKVIGSFLKDSSAIEVSIANLFTKLEIYELAADVLKNITYAKIGGLINSIMGVLYGDERDIDLNCGQLVADICDIAGDAYTSLSADTLNAISLLISVIDGDAGLNAADQLKGLIAAGKTAATESEYVALGKQFTAIFNLTYDDEDEDENELSVSFNGVESIAVAENFDNNAVIRAVSRSANRYDDSVRDIDFRSYNYYVTEVLGCRILRVVNDEGAVEDSVLLVVTDGAATEYKVFMRYGIRGLTASNQRVSEISDSVRYMIQDEIAYYDPNSGRCVYGYDISGLNITVPSISNAKGYHAGVARVLISDIAFSVDVPFVYYIYDENDPEVVGLSYYSLRHGFLVNATEEEVRQYLYVSIRYDNGCGEQVDDWYFSDFDTSTPGSKTITINYGDYSTELYITVYETEEIEYLAAYTTSSIYVGTTVDEFKERFYVYLRYNTGREERIYDYELSGFDSSRVGEIFVTIQYGELTDGEYVYIYERPQAIYDKVELLKDAVTCLAENLDGIIADLGNGVDGECVRLTLGGDLEISGENLFIDGGARIYLEICPDDFSVRINLVNNEDYSVTTLALIAGGKLVLGDEFCMDVSGIYDETAELIWTAVSYLWQEVEDDIGTDRPFENAVDNFFGDGGSIASIFARVFDIEETSDYYQLTITGKNVKSLYSLLRNLIADSDKIDAVLEGLFGDLYEDLKEGYVSIDFYIYKRDLGVKIALTDSRIDGHVSLALDAEAKVNDDDVFDTSDYTPTDIVIKVPFELQQKNLSGEAEIVLHTSDCFSAKGKDFITVTATVNDIENAFVFVLNDGYEYMDATALFNVLGGTTEYATKYYAPIDPDDDMGLIDMIVSIIEDAVNSLNDKGYDDYDETANFAPGYYEDEEENFIYDIRNLLARYSTFFDSANLGRTIDNLKVLIERYSYILENSVTEETDSEIVIAVNGFNYDVFDFIGKFFVDEYGNELTLEYLVNQLDEEEAELIGDIFGIDVNDLIEGLILTLGVEEREFDEHYVDYYYAMIGCSQGTVLEIAIAADLYEETETYVITAEDIAGASDNSHYVTQEERDENGDWYITEISDAQFMLEDLLKAFLDYGKR